MLKPSTFTYIIEHDDDISFLADAIQRVGPLLEPTKTLPTVVRLARPGHNWQVRCSALNAILFATLSKKLPTGLPAVEDVALDCLHGPGDQMVTSMGILSFYPTPRAKRALRGIRNGPYEKFLRDEAARALRGAQWNIGR